MQGFLMATAVCGVRRRGAGMRSVGTVRFMRGVWVRLDIPRGFAVPLCGLARAMIYRRGMPGFFDGNGGMRVAGVWHNKTVTNGG